VYIFVCVEVIIYSGISDLEMYYALAGNEAERMVTFVTNESFYINEDGYLSTRIINMFDGGYTKDNIYFDVISDMGLMIEVVSGEFMYNEKIYNNEMGSNLLYIDNINSNSSFAIMPLIKEDIKIYITPFYYVDGVEIPVGTLTKGYTIAVKARATNITTAENKNSATLSAINTENLELVMTTPNVTENGDDTYTIDEEDLVITLCSNVTNNVIGTTKLSAANIDYSNLTPGVVRNVDVKLGTESFVG